MAHTQPYLEAMSSPTLLPTHCRHGADTHQLRRMPGNNYDTCANCYATTQPRIEQIEHAIRDMRRRLAEGQGTRASAMCRLSLDMSVDLMVLFREACDVALEAGKRHDTDELEDIDHIEVTYHGTPADVARRADADAHPWGEPGAVPTEPGQYEALWNKARERCLLSFVATAGTVLWQFAFVARPMVANATDADDELAVTVFSPPSMRRLASAYEVRFRRLTPTAPKGD